MMTCSNTLQDGINRHILAIAPEIARHRECEVAVCSTFKRGELHAALVTAGVLSYALDLPHGHDWRMWCRLRKVVRDFKPDIIHAHVLGLFARSFLDCFYPHLPIVYTCHGITDVESGVRKIRMRDRLDGIMGRLRLGGGRRPTTTVYISEGVRQFKGAKGAPVVYNPVTFDAARAVKDTNVLRMELGVTPDTPIIGTACRISLPKCPEKFTDVMCRVLKASPSAHAVVCGTASDECLVARLKDIVAKSGVLDRFHWLGYRKDAQQIIRELDCFVMTSATEGMPTALLEAMSVKTPIAFLRGKGGLVDLDAFDKAEGPIAIVSDADDLDGFSRKIVGLLQDNSQALANAERAFACGSRHFDVDRIGTQLVGVYGGLVA